MTRENQNISVEQSTFHMYKPSWTRKTVYIQSIRYIETGESLFFFFFVWIHTSWMWASSLIKGNISVLANVHSYEIQNWPGYFYPHMGCRSREWVCFPSLCSYADLYRSFFLEERCFLFKFFFFSKIQKTHYSQTCHNQTCCNHCLQENSRQSNSLESNLLSTDLLQHIFLTTV